LFLSASSGGAEDHGHGVDFDTSTASEVAGQDHGRGSDRSDTSIRGAQKNDSRNDRLLLEPNSGPKSLAAALFVHSSRDVDKQGNTKEQKDLPGRALGHEKPSHTDSNKDADAHGHVIIGSSGNGRGERPVDPYIENGKGNSSVEGNSPTPGYKQRDPDAGSNSDRLPVSGFDLEEVYRSVGPSPSLSSSKSSGSTTEVKSVVDNSKPVTQAVAVHVNQVAHVERVVAVTAPRETRLEVVVPENVEPAAATEEPSAKTAPETETPIEEPSSQPVTSAADTVSAQPLGAAGAPVERLLQEVQGENKLPSEQDAEDATIDLTSAAVSAFWAAVEVLPVAPIAAASAGLDDGLAEAVRVNFESLTAAVDTLLDTLAAQFDLSGPGRTRDLIFASSAALLAALACEKVRRRQQRLEDENLASLGFDADGYLSLAEGL
jgi:hypothetical protein